MDLLVEVRGVNHRYLEASVRLPHAYSYLEDRIKKQIAQCVARGKVEMSVSIQLHGMGETTVDVNTDLAAAYIQALRQANTQLSLQDDVTLSTLLRFSDVFSVRKMQLDEEVVWTAVAPVVAQALEQFVNMRALEGERMRADVLSRLNALEQMCVQVEAAAPETAKRYYDRLYAKLSELLADREVDASRLVTEAAVLAERIAVDEETVRLHSHISQFRTLLDTEEPVGRKLDFLVQEMNREVNTTGSKAQDLSITRLVVDMKSEIEKIREQIQNIE
jgi:uncharacterized protein (TIGR00255 family)